MNRCWIAFCGYPEPARRLLARRLAQQRQATYSVDFDAIEEALLADGGARLVDRGAGYRVACAVAEENFEIGQNRDCRLCKLHSKLRAMLGAKSPDVPAPNSSTLR